jgi:hypothetical protein
VYFWPYCAAIKPGASLYIRHSSSKQRKFQNALEQAGFEVRCQIIWAENTPTMKPVELIERALLNSSKTGPLEEFVQSKVVVPFRDRRRDALPRVALDIKRKERQANMAAISRSHSRLPRSGAIRRPAAEQSRMAMALGWRGRFFASQRYPV